MILPVMFCLKILIGLDKFITNYFNEVTCIVIPYGKRYIIHVQQSGIWKINNKISHSWFYTIACQEITH